MISIIKKNCSSIKASFTKIKNKLTLLFLCSLFYCKNVYAKNINNPDKDIEFLVKCINLFLQHGDELLCTILVFKLIKDIRNGLDTYEGISYWIRILFSYIIAFSFTIIIFSKIKALQIFN